MTLYNWRQKQRGKSTHGILNMNIIKISAHERTISCKTVASWNIIVDGPWPVISNSQWSYSSAAINCFLVRIPNDDGYIS